MDKNKEQLWDEFLRMGRVDFPRPFDDLDELYMTDKQKQQLYKEATEELRLRVKLLQQKKKGGVDAKDV